jgi:hypothetical protein
LSAVETCHRNAAGWGHRHSWSGSDSFEPRVHHRSCLATRWQCVFRTAGSIRGWERRDLDKHAWIEYQNTRAEHWRVVSRCWHSERLAGRIFSSAAGFGARKPRCRPGAQLPGAILGGLQRNVAANVGVVADRSI